MFILLAQSKDSALVAADKFYRILGTDMFRVTTDGDVAKGMDKAPFYKYLPGEDGAVGKLRAGRAVIFSQKEN